MAAEPDVADPPPTRLRRWVSALGFREIWQVGLAVFLAATWIFGGLDTVDTKAIPMKAGEPFNDGEFTITIERATAVDKLSQSTLTPPEPGRRYLGIVVTIRNEGTVAGYLKDEIDLRGQSDKKFVGVYRMSDSSMITALGPKLTENVVFIWQLPVAALQPGSTVTLRVWRKEFRELIVTYGKDWLETDYYGEIQLPVKVKS